MPSVDKNDKDTSATKDGAKAAAGATNGANGATLSAVPAVAVAPALPPRDAARDKAIDLAVSTIEKQFGKGSIMRLGEDMAAPEVKVVPTGSLGLDIALGVGGLPRGRIVEIYGPESSGKTTLALHVVGEAQKAGGICAFVDAEHALDVSYARKLGVRTDDLLVSQPDCGEQALEITEMLVRSGAVDIVVVDSVAALTPKAELEGEMGDAHVGLQARLMSQALRKLTGTISKSNTLVIFINQIRMKIGVMFGNPETTTGGNALKFYASCRLDIRRIGALKDGDKVVGNRTRVKVVKNKMAPPFREVEFDIMYGEGISHTGDLVDLGSECGAVEKSGAWFSVDGERIGQGRDNAKQFLLDHPDLARKIEIKVLAHHGIKRDVGPPALVASGVASGGSAGATVHPLSASPGRPSATTGDKRGK
jgi:recombination protein RecA